MKCAAAFWRIVSLRLTLGLLMPLAILSGLLTLGSGCGERGSHDSLRGVPQWSPDGNHIVFDKYRNYDGIILGDIYIVRSDGSWLERIDGSWLERLSVTSGTYDYWPDVSPDGSRVVYTTSHDDTEYRRNLEIETSKLDGSNRRRLTENRVWDRRPVWSPDGGQVAFSSNDDHGYDNIMVMSADGSDKRIIFKTGVFDPGAIHSEPGSRGPLQLDIETGPEWSPDGETLAFVSADTSKRSSEIGSPSILFTVGTDGDGLTPLFVSHWGEGSIAPAVTWSPDGRELAFMQHDSAAGEWGEWILYAIGQDGSGLRKVAEVPIRGGFSAWYALSSLSWSPNGDEILFVLNRAMYVAKADGSGHREVAGAPYASWSPDSSRIAISGGSGFYLTAIAADGSDEQVLVYEYTDGSLGAANPGPKKCILWICW